jgi:hypothetical protein
MNRERYDQYVRDYIREALIYGDNDVGAAANWLMAQRTPRFFAREEQKEALRRTQKVFNSYQDRPLWFVLKCFDLTEEDLK